MVLAGVIGSEEEAALITALLIGSVGVVSSSVIGLIWISFDITYKITRIRWLEKDCHELLKVLV